MKPKMYTIIFIMLMMGYATLHCQKDTTETREAYRKRVHQEELDKFGLTEKKLDKLNEIGVDLRHGKVKSHEMAKAACSDAVVVVTIIGISDWPGPKEQLFHSKVKARIQEVLKGKAIVGDTVELLEESGRVSDSTEYRMVVSEEAYFKYGEEYIIFLRRMNKDTYLTSPFNRKSFDRGNFGSDSTRFYVGGGSSIPIQNGKIYVSGLLQDVTQLKGDIKKVASVLEQQ
jgi:hypothetical protein